MGLIEKEKIVLLLQKSGVRFELLEHAPVVTSKEAAAIRSVGLHRGVKAIVVQSNLGRFFLFCLPADKRINLKKAAKLAGEKRLFLASPQDVFRVTGCKVGSVSPFLGCITPNLPVFLDESVLQNEYVDFSVGVHTHSVEMKSKDLARLTRSAVANFVVQK